MGISLGGKIILIRIFEKEMIELRHFLSGLCYLYTALVRHKDLVFY